jgi:hypothetical protein
LGISKFIEDRETLKLTERRRELPTKLLLLIIIYFINIMNRSSFTLKQIKKVFNKSRWFLYI